MTHLTRWSLANRLIIGLATIAIVIFGLISTFSLKQELLPSITAPTAFVTATYPGATPQIVADNVSSPIERAVTGVSGVTDVTSTSVNGNATISVSWDYGLDNDKVVGNIRNAVDSVKATLPTSVETDVITGSTDDIPVLLLAVSTDLPLDTSDGPIKLSQVADVKLESVSSSSLARADGRPALSVSVLKETDGDSVAISHAVNAMLPSLEQTIGNNAKFNTVF